MKTILYSFIFHLFPLLIIGQVQVRSLPVAGYEKRISDYVDNLNVVDTHEHLMDPAKLKQKTTLDFMLLLQHYSAHDIRSSGMSNQTFATLLKDSLTVKEKWQILKPFWEGSFNTAYNRVALMSADKLFGIDDINESTVELLSEKISQSYQLMNWPDQVFKKGKIDFVIQDSGDRGFTNERFRYVVRFDSIITIRKQVINNLENQYNISIKTLDDLVVALEKVFESAKEKGMVGVKSGLAYRRILFYENVNKEEAQKVLELILDDQKGKNLSFDELKPLQDYMMHRVLELADKNQLPVVLHTGLHAGNGNIIENSNPTHLVNLFQQFPDVKFVLYHGSYPYGGELSTLAKNFRNVYIDLCWLYIISPSYSSRYLHEWLETIPASKIMGFGGDYQNVENVYGHLLFAKQIIANVLTEKVRDGYFSEPEAMRIAKMILYDNAVNLYKLSF